MWKLGTARRRWGLALRFAEVVSAGGRPRARTRGALCTPVLFFAVCTLALGTLAAFCEAEQEASPSAGRPVGVRSQPSIQAATAITQVDMRRTGQEAIVRVEGDGRLTVHPFRLPSPERLVLDFSGARLALAHPPIRGALKPVRGVRVGQFKPDVARVVIDLEQVAPYVFKSEGKSVTVSFALAREAPSTEPAASPTETGHARPLVPVHRTETSPPAPMSPATFGASGMLRPELLRELTGALADPVPPEVEPSENASHSVKPPVFGQRRQVDFAQLKKEAEELARLAGSIPAQIEQVAQGKLPKDFPEKLKQIDKLAKRLRAEVMP